MRRKYLLRRHPTTALPSVPSNCHAPDWLGIHVRASVIRPACYFFYCEVFTACRTIVLHRPICPATWQCPSEHRKSFRAVGSQTDILAFPHKPISLVHAFSPNSLSLATDHYILGILAYVLTTPGTRLLSLGVLPLTSSNTDVGHHFLG